MNPGHWYTVTVFDTLATSSKLNWCAERLRYQGQPNGWTRVYCGWDGDRWSEVVNYCFSNEEDATAFSLAFGKDICRDY